MAVEASNFDSTTFGKYRLIAKLATGGMGEIFLARRTGLAGFEKLVVIKRLLPHLAEDTHFVNMLFDEARIAARLSHPNVCQVFDLGQAEGKFYIAMEYLEGVPSSQVLQRARRAKEYPDTGMVTAILHQACQGLEHAHNLTDKGGKSFGLVHRDVSPSNLFLTTPGVVKVLDFGVAKSQGALAKTNSGTLKGKYAYMSPEQVLGEHVDRRSDVFALGIVLFELLTVRRLFWRDSEYKMLSAVVEEDIPSVLDFRPDLPEEFAAVLERALSREPEGRYETAKEMGEAIVEASKSVDGPWTNAALADYVCEHFAGEIGERRELAEKSVVENHSMPTVSDGRLDMGEHSDELTPATRADIPSRSEAATEAAAPRRWLPMLLATAGLLVGGGVAAWALQDSDEPPPAPVVVVSGDVSPDDGKEETPTDPPGDPGSVESAALDAGLALSAEAKIDSGPPKPKVKRVEQDPFTRAFAKQRGKIRGCFNEHASGVEGTPRVTVTLRVASDGHVSKATLKPGDLGATPLGKCLMGVARGTSFPRQSEPVEVSFPLKVRKRGG